MREQGKTAYQDVWVLFEGNLQLLLVSHSGKRVLVHRVRVVEEQIHFARELNAQGGGAVTSLAQHQYLDMN